MTLSMILFGILPLIAFVIIDSFCGIKAGILAAILLSFAEFIYSLVVDGSIDYIALLSTALILVFGFLSLRSKSPLFIKLQPVLLGILFGLALLISSFFSHPLLVFLAQKYQTLMPEQFRSLIVEPQFVALLERLTNVLGIGFLIHAGLVALTAFYSNSWWWLIMRGVGLYGMMLICTLYVRFF